MNKLQIGLVILILVSFGGIFWLYGPRERVFGISTAGSGSYEIEIPERVSAADPFVIKVIVDTKGKNVNAVGLNLKFATNRLQILNMDTTGSFCEFYPENRYDNQNGLIKISCGLPSPGFNGKGTLAEITFEALSVGIADIEILPDSLILLNDGKGTNILKEYAAEEILVVANL